MGNVVEETWERKVLVDALEQADISSSHSLIASFKSKFAEKFTPSSELYTGASARELLRSLFFCLKQKGYIDVWLCHYNCPVVIAAAKASGLSVKFFSAAMLWDERSAINDFRPVSKSAKSIWVIPHLFGRPSYLPFDLPKSVREQFFIIEDCAHTLGASHNGNSLGSCFDAGVFSFNLDKPISLLGGGAIAMNTDRAKQYYSPPRIEPKDDSAEILKAAGDWALLLKTIKSQSKLATLAYRAKYKLGLVKTPQTHFEFGPVRAALGLAALQNFDWVQDNRQARNERIFGEFTEQTIPTPKNTIASYIRKRVLIEDSNQRKKFCKTLASFGILSGNLNWPNVQGGVSPQFDQKWATFGVDIPIDLFVTEDQETIIRDALAKTDFSVL